MNSLYCERYEVPLPQLEGRLFLHVMCHASKVLLVNVIYMDVTQAVYYPPAGSEMPCTEAERACRMALGHFKSRSFDLYTQPRKSITRRCVLMLDTQSPVYDGVLFKLDEETPNVNDLKGPSLSAS